MVQLAGFFLHNTS